MKFEKVDVRLAEEKCIFLDFFNLGQYATYSTTAIGQRKITYSTEPTEDGGSIFSMDSAEIRICFTQDDNCST